MSSYFRMLFKKKKLCPVMMHICFKYPDEQSIRMNLILIKWFGRILYNYIFLCYTVLVAEVTQPSLGVGYEIGRAVDLKIKTLCLFRPDGDKSMYNKHCYSYVFASIC